MNAKPQKENEYMRKLLLVAFLVLGYAPFAVAQSDSSRAELFAGYSILRTDYKAKQTNPPMPVIVFFRGDQTLNGFNVSGTGYFSRRFGITGDFSGHFKTNSLADPLGGNIETRIRIFNVLGGPQYKFRNNSRATPFVHALAGITHTRARLSVASLRTSETRSSTDFALALGGGLDVRVSDRIALRVIQLDYSPVFLRSNNELGFSGTANNVRFSFGVVFR